MLNSTHHVSNEIYIDVDISTLADVSSV